MHAEVFAREAAGCPRPRPSARLADDTGAAVALVVTGGAGFRHERLALAHRSATWLRAGYRANGIGYGER